MAFFDRRTKHCERQESWRERSESHETLVQVGPNYTPISWETR
jgi:hypothetical protein